MKKLEFRAWDKKNRKMIYPDPLSSCSLFMTWEGAVYIQGELQDYEMLQFTGLCDKHRKKIFEGDICLNHSKYYKGEIGIIESSLFYFGFTVNREFKEQDREWVESWSDWFEINPPDTKTEVEIIGNIYENPELIEGEK